MSNPLQPSRLPKTSGQSRENSPSLKRDTKKTVLTPGTRNSKHALDYSGGDDAFLFSDDPGLTSAVPTHVNVRPQQTINGSGSKTFSVTFRVLYKTDPGEDLFVSGSLPELGAVEAKKHPLVWTAGHVWVSKAPLRTTRSDFTYRYVMHAPGGRSDKEEGDDRLAKLELLAPFGDVAMHDQWNKHKVCFQVFYPELEPHERMQV
jgi:hypothetical protein